MAASRPAIFERICLGLNTPNSPSPSVAAPPGTCKARLGRNILQRLQQGNVQSGVLQNNRKAGRTNMSTKEKKGAL